MTMAKVKVTYWKEIPVSVMVKETRDNKANVQLPKIYMVTVDAVATKSGATSAADYAAGFRTEDSERECSDAKVLAEQIVKELEGKYPKEWLWEQRAKAGITVEGQQQCEEEAVR
jgi:hypothetical protein